MYNMLKRYFQSYHHRSLVYILLSYRSLTSQVHLTNFNIDSILIKMINFVLYSSKVETNELIECWYISSVFSFIDILCLCNAFYIQLIFLPTSSEICCLFLHFYALSIFVQSFTMAVSSYLYLYVSVRESV